MRRLSLLFLLVLSTCLGATPALAAAPTATTGDAFSNSPSTANLAGSVMRNGEDTTYFFEYGQTTGYGQKTADAVLTESSPVGGCAGCHPVTAQLSGLSSGTTYHYRLVATNASGPASGVDRTFTTQAAQQPPPADRDFDNVPDSSDACPDQHGQGAANGCPPPPPTDSDRDGTPDSMDACPTIPGPPAGSNNANGCPPPPAQNTGPQPPSPDDLDADGVLNAKDMCPKSFQKEKVDADGCGPFNGRSGFGARSTLEIQDDPGVSLQCNNNKGKVCKARLTMMLSAASARKLGIARKLFDVTIKATKKFQGGAIVTGGRDIRFSRTVEKAFKRAYEDRIPVTMTFDGTMTHGTKTYPYTASTFTMKRKPPGGSAYRVEPFLDHGDKGASSGGLTRKADPNDF